MLTILEHLKMQVRTSAVATATNITNNLALLHIATGANNQAAHMGIGCLKPKIMTNTDIATIATIPAGLLHIARGRCINRSTILIGNINARMPGLTITTKGIGATAKIGGNFAAGSGPLARRNITTIIFIFNST